LRDQPARAPPVERRARIGLAARRDVAVADHAPRRQPRIGAAQHLDDGRERAVLHPGVGAVIAAFELHADGKIVAGLAPPVARFSGMPGPVAEADELRDRPVAPHQQMRRHPQIRDRAEIRMRVGGQGIGEQPLDPRAAELPRGQADAVHDDQLRPRSGRPRIVIRRLDEGGAAQQAAAQVDPQSRQARIGAAH